MSAKAIGILLVLLAVALESFAQMFLKLGTASSPDKQIESNQKNLARFLLARRWMILGAVLLIAELAVYTLALHKIDVSLAFPLSALSFVGIAILSMIFIGEKVNAKRWAGIAFILFGTVLVGAC